MNKFKFLISAFFLLSIGACQEEEIMNDGLASPTLKQEVYNVMQEWYLWNDLIPEIDYNAYATADGLLNAMMYHTLDQWSYIEEEEEYDAFFENAQYEGYGVRLAFDEAENLRVAFVYQDSPFGKAGVDRAWIIHKINGALVSTLSEEGSISRALEGDSHTFEFILPDGSIQTESLSKTSFVINTVLRDDIYQLGDQTIGYLVFNNFLATSLDELKLSFQKFRDAQVQELIIDLRYNGGGRVNIAQWMATNILGSTASGKNFIEYEFNANKADDYNEVIPFGTTEIPLDLSRVIFITSGGSASASELLINGLKPFVDVKLIGNNTYGKPVGSFPHRYEGYAINPISFKIQNDQGVGEYYDGILADAYVMDDLSHRLGDPAEARLYEALYYISNGAFSGQTARQAAGAKKKEILMRGFRREIGAY